MIRMERCNGQPTKKCLWVRLLPLLGLLIELGFGLFDSWVFGSLTPFASADTKGEVVTQISLAKQCRGPNSLSSNLPNVMTLMQPVHFSHPANTIRIGLPLLDSSVAHQTWVQIGERNGYSPEMIQDTLSGEWPLTLDTTTGLAYSPYFSYTVMPSKSYLVHVRSTKAGGLAHCDVLLDGYYQKAGISVTSIEVYSDKQRIDPYGLVEAGTTLRIVVHLVAPNSQWSSLTAHLSYRLTQDESSPSEWIHTSVKFTPYGSTLQGDWVLPGNASPAYYDLKIEVEDGYNQGVVWQELTEFQVVKSDTPLSKESLTSENNQSHLQFEQSNVLSDVSQPDLLMGMYISSRGWYYFFEELVLLPRGEEIRLLGFPLPSSPNDLPSQWKLTMSVRLQGTPWITLPPPEWFPDTSPDAWLATWVIPNDSELGPYDVRFEATNSDGSWTADYVINEGFTVVDDQVIYQEWGDGIAYIDRTHRSALPMVIEATPSPVDYSLAYFDPGHIQVVPKSNVRISEWGIVNFVETVDFPISSTDHAVALADIDGDGKLEIVRVLMHAIEVMSIGGRLLWSYNLPSSADQILVDDIDFDGKSEILVTTSIIGLSGYGSIIVLDQKGNLKWQNRVWSNAHGIAVWHPTAGGVGQVIVGTCANLLYVFSHEGMLLNWKRIVPGEWSSIDSIAVGDVDGDGQDEFVLGVWRMNRTDLWVLTPTLETKWTLTLDSLGVLGVSLGATPVLDGIALIPAPSGGQFIWVATSPLYYNVVVDPILLQIDGRSAQVVAEYHLNRYVPVQGARDVRDFIRLKPTIWDDSYVSSEVLVEVSGQLLAFNSEGLKGIIKLSEAAIVSSSNVIRLANGDTVMAVSYSSNSTGELRVKILRQLKLSTVRSATFPYCGNAMQARLVVNFSDLLGLNYTLVVDLPPYEPRPLLFSIKPEKGGVGPLIHRTIVYPSNTWSTPRSYELPTPAWPTVASEPTLEKIQQEEGEVRRRAEEEGWQPWVEEKRQPELAQDRDKRVPTVQKDTALTPPHTELYKILLKSTKEETGRLLKGQQHILELIEKKKEADIEVAEKRQEVQLIKLKLVDPKKPEKVKQKKEDDEAEKLLREAEEASRKAEEARQKVVKDLTEAISEKQKAEQIIGRNRAIFEQVETNPERAPDYLTQFKKQEEGR